jgi:hypothetical protein
MLTRFVEPKISKRTIHCDTGAKKRSRGIKWQTIGNVNHKMLVCN